MEWNVWAENFCLTMQLKISAVLLAVPPSDDLISFNFLSLMRKSRSSGSSSLIFKFLFYFNSVGASGLSKRFDKLLGFLTRDIPHPWNEVVKGEG